MNIKPRTGRKAGESNEGTREATKARRQKVMTRDS